MITPHWKYGVVSLTALCGVAAYCSSQPAQQMPQLAQHKKIPTNRIDKSPVRKQPVKYENRLIEIDISDSCYSVTSEIELESLVSAIAKHAKVARFRQKWWCSMGSASDSNDILYDRKSHFVEYWRESLDGSAGTGSSEHYKVFDIDDETLKNYVEQPNIDDNFTNYLKKTGHKIQNLPWWQDSVAPK